MSRDLDLLIPDFRARVEEVLAACLNLGVEMRPYFTLRDPWTQAKFWRQSRPIELIEAKIRELERNGAPFLAHILHSVGPQHGDPVTDALPGLSWHQWGEAVDCFWLLNNDAEWSTRTKIRLPDGREINGYHLYGEEGEKRGLTSGGFWHDLIDWPHLQQRTGSVLNFFAWPEIDQEMLRRFESGAPAAMMAAEAAPAAAVMALAAPAALPNGFVQVVGDKFCVRGKKFRFVGVNIRGLVHYGAPYDQFFLRARLDPARNWRAEQLQLAYHNCGARVVRVFLPHENASKEQIAQRLDALLTMIKVDLGFNDLYLIPALTNFYGDVPFRIQGDQGFYSTTGDHNPLTAGFFGEGYRRENGYLTLVKHIVEQFKDEPNIFAWEIGNELKVDPLNPNTQDHLRLFIGFMHHVARVIRKIDSHHLITTGMISTAHAWMGQKTDAEQQAQRVRLYNAPRNPTAGDQRPMFDFVTVHYPRECHGANGFLGCNSDDIQLAKDLGLPFIIEEDTMTHPHDHGQDRTPRFKQALEEWFGRGASSYMPWGFDGVNVGDGDDGGVGGDNHADWNQLSALFKEFAQNVKESGECT